MAVRVSNAEDLAKAMNDDVDEIIIEGEFGDKVWKIKVTGKVAWAVAIGCIAVAIAIAIAGGPAAPASAAALAPAVGVLGVGATTAAIGIGIAAGGVSALKKLRKYDYSKDTEGNVVLTK